MRNRVFTILSPARPAAKGTVSRQARSNSRTGEIGLLEIGKDLLGDRLNRADIIVDGVLVGIDRAGIDKAVGQRDRLKRRVGLYLAAVPQLVDGVGADVAL